MGKQARPPIDWAAVELDYRTGRFTDRVLSTKYGAAHTTISRRAKRDGWQRDLAEAVAQRTRELLKAAEEEQTILRLRMATAKAAALAQWSAARELAAQLGESTAPDSPAVRALVNVLAVNYSVEVLGRGLVALRDRLEAGAGPPAPVASR